MTLGDGDLAEIVARSSTLYERFAGIDADLERADAARVSERLRRWRESCANGDGEEFARRLRDDGLDPAAFDGVLGEVRLTAGTPLPRWAYFLRDALDAAAAWTDHEIFAPHPAPGAFPFFALLRPFTEHAFALLGRHDPALDSPRTALVHLVSQHAALAFGLEFTIFKAREESALAALLRRSDGASSDRLYRDFVHGFRAGRWRPFLVEYAVLSRQIATACLNWVDATAELLERLAADRQALADRFFDGSDPGQLERVEAGISDRHNGGRATAILHFASGARVVYKPKPLDTDVLMGELVEWVNARGTLLRLESVAVLDRGDYGWHAFVAHAACENEDAVRRFYVRSGYQLALVYALEGYDCHHENIIASGEQPYLIDTETIFNPYKEMDALASAEPNAALLAGETVFYSVIRTGMLPHWNVGDGGRRDTSGFGGGSVAGNEQQRRSAWIGTGGDDVRLEAKYVPVKTLANVPFVAGHEPENAERYVAEILTGFRAMYAFLSEHGHELAALVARHPATRVRFVRRPTSMYAEHAWILANPEYLRTGIDWSIGLEQLARMFLAAKSANRDVWRLLRAEYQAMMQLDIPYFQVRSDGLDVRTAGDETIASGYFTTGCFERLQEKLARLSARDLALQERYVAYAFYARGAQSLHDLPGTTEALLGAPKADTAALAPVGPETCIAVAEEIARELEAEAVRAPDGTVAWIALEYLKEADVFQLKPISYNFYSGAIGVAYFLAALARVTDNERYAALCEAAVRPILFVVDNELDALVRSTGVGGGVGVGSLIYGLASIAQMLGETPFAERALAYAKRCALHCDDAVVRRDVKLDLIFGTAGFVLALAKLYRLTRDGEILERLRGAASFLTERGNATPWGDGVIPTYQGQAITGMSHGAAGVALALARAYEVTGEAAFLDAAAAQIAYEERRYDPEARNYPDYRTRTDAPSYMTTWCHGAPGIGLSRLATYGVTQDRALLAQIERNVETTGAFTLDHIDHVCCGNVGRLDVRLECARRLGDAALLDSVRRDAAYVVDRYRASGGFRMVVNAPNKVFSPGFFVGATGIAYSLLRLARPDALPCVLAFD